MELKGRTALVTGASGFVGGHVARRLAQDEGMTVRALTRHPEAKTVIPLEHPAIELVKGDLLDPASLEKACDGAAVVFHAAVDTNAANPDIARATIVEGTRSLHHAAQSVGVQRFIYMSGFMVYYGVRDDFADEDTPLVPYGDVFGDAKIAAEELLLGDRRGGSGLTILRAPAIYGPGSRRWAVRMMQDAQKGRLYLPGGGNFPFPYVYIDNLVDAIVAAAQMDAPLGIYNVVDGRTTYREFAEPFAKLAGTKPRSLPLWLLWIAAYPADAISKLTGRWMPISRAAVQLMSDRGRRRYATADRARRELGWEPRVDLLEGMRRTEAWLRQNGHL